MALTPRPYTREELQGFLAANGGRFGGWGLDTARMYATIATARAEGRADGWEAAAKVADRHNAAVASTIRLRAAEALAEQEAR